MSHPILFARGAGPLRLFAVSLLVSGLLLSACASNPYIANTRPVPPSTSEIPSSERLQYALSYADRTYDAYAEKLPEEFIRQRAVSGTLITVGAVALGLTTFGAHRDAIAGMALGGGYVYALGSWNTSQGRPGIYLEGMKAVSCAKSAVAPLRLGTAQLAAIRNQAQHTAAAAARASRSAGEVTRWLSIAANRDGPTSPSSLATAAGAELTALSSSLNKANELLARAAGVDQRVGGAAMLLESHVDEIRRIVDSALNGTLSDLSMLPRVIGSLSSYANVVLPGITLEQTMSGKVNAGKSLRDGAVNAEQGPIDDSGSASVKVVDPVAQLAFSLGKLRASALILSTEIFQLSGVVETMTLEQVKVAMTGCGVDTSKGGAVLRVDRSTVSFIAGTAGVALIAVDGGTRPYAANLMDLPAKGINVSAPAGGAMVAINAEAGTEAGRSYAVRISDSAGAISTVMVNVLAKAVENSAAGTGSIRQRAAPTEESGPLLCTGGLRPAEDICLMQQVVGSRITGKLDSDTCRAFRSSEVTKSFNGMLNDQAMGFIKERSRLSPSASPAQMLTRLVELGASRCPGAKSTADPAPVPTATRPSGSCVPPPNDRKCPVEGARCDFECQLSVGEVRSIGSRLGLKPAPDHFSSELRELLIRFQKDRKVGNQDGNYDTGTAEAVQNLPLN